jgi:hypothetical protein
MPLTVTQEAGRWLVVDEEHTCGCGNSLREALLDYAESHERLEVLRGVLMLRLEETLYE